MMLFVGLFGVSCLCVLIVCFYCTDFYLGLLNISMCVVMVELWFWFIIWCIVSWMSMVWLGLVSM